MKCLSCGEEISTKMKGSLKANLCPFCGKHVMDTFKAKQYNLLIEALAVVKLTNKADIDEQIKEKVIGILAEQFKFERIDLPPKKDDLICVDEDEVEGSPPPKITIPMEKILVDDDEDEDDSLPVRSMQEAAQSRPKTEKLVKNQKSSSSDLARMYKEMANSQYEGQSEGSSSDYEENGNSESEVEDSQKYFTDGLPPELAAKVERLKAKKMSETTGGIKRLR